MQVRESQGWGLIQLGRVGAWVLERRSTGGGDREREKEREEET